MTQPEVCLPASEIEELRRTQIQLTEAQRIGNFGSWHWDIGTNVLSWSDQVYRIFGVEPQIFPATYEAFLSYVHPDDRERVHAAVNEALYAGKPYSIEHRVRRADGSERTVHEVAEARFAADGRPEEMIGTVHDVTERKAAESALRVAEERYRNLVETAPSAILLVDPQGRIEFANDQAVDWFGYSREELLGQPVELLIPHRQRQAHLRQRHEYIKHPAKRPMGKPGLELRGRRKDGSEFPLDIGLSPLETPGGTTVTVVMRDMTEREKRESQLRYLSAAGRVLAESLEYEDTLERTASLALPEMADGCVVALAAEDGKWELAAIAHRDARRKELLQQSFALLPAQFAGCRASGKAVLGGALSESGPLAEIGILSHAIAPILAHGKTLGLILFLSDVSRRRFEQSDLAFFEQIAVRAALSIENARLYREAQRAVAAREEVLGVVSHDLRSPLAAISIGSQVLRRIDPADRGRWESAVKAIQSAAGRMERLIEDLLDFVRIQAGRLPVEAQPEHIREVIAPVLEQMKDQLEAKHLKLEADIPPGLPDVLCDRHRLHQVLSNLLGNAIKFTPEQGGIRVTARDSEQGVEVSVADTGPGIPPEQLSGVFERFWQANAARRSGAGLGLSIAKGIIEAHGGTIRAESRVGLGSTFSFTLPRCERPRSALFERDAAKRPRTAG